MTHNNLKGIFAAAVTPLTADGKPNLADLPSFLGFLAQRGCHGALLLGTTGEGPSFSTKERLAIFKAAGRVREEYPSFRLLAGTGSPSLEETIELTKGAYELGFDGVVSLPPYYFRDATEEGLFKWFSQILNRATPAEGGFFGYHFPAVSGVPLTIDLLSRLKNTFPEKFAGLKDSSGDPVRGRQIGARFGDSLSVYTGNDRLLRESLDYHGAGCITAAANLISTFLRRVWDAHEQGEEDPEAQSKIIQGRKILEGFKPFAPSIKAVLGSHYNQGLWATRPPLIALPTDSANQLTNALSDAGLLS